MLKIKNISFLTAVILILNVIFVSGQVFGQIDNRSPVLQTVPDQYLLEGESINFTVKATDTDSDNMAISMASRPLGATLIDNGDGTAQFSWKADFTGPNSADGSPFEVVFLANDGISSSSMVTKITVINSNRSPYIVSPDTVTIQSGDEINFDLYGYDPDFDATSWKLISKPDGMLLTGSNPATADWATSFADSGFHPVNIELSDKYGATDTAEVVMKVLQTTVYSLSIDTISAYPSEVVEIDINLMNLEAISDINLVINYDASVLTFLGLTNQGTRIENWELFSYTINYRNITGDIHIVGTADIANELATESLQPGDGAILKLTLGTSYDLNYAGFSIPVNFVYRDNINGFDNTMTSDLGEFIAQDMIEYENGYVTMQTVDEKHLGDINRNGVPYEIGDVIRFTNYFIYPEKYGLDPVQILNSDVNRDGYGATIADLVYMIRLIVNLGTGIDKIMPDFGSVDIIASNQNGKTTFYYNSDYNLGGMVVDIDLDRSDLYNTDYISGLENLGMTVKSSIVDDKMRLLIYGESGAQMPSGTHRFLELENNANINEIHVSSYDGYLVETVMKSESNGIIPGSYTLYQNYPNPFNPETSIRFELPYTANVELTVYNILGQEVIKLVNGPVAAGQHSVTWDGTADNGESVASGIYFYRLKSDGFNDQKKMVLLK